MMLSCQYGPKSQRNVSNTLFFSVPQRIKAVLKAKGGPTWYWQGAHNKAASECVCVCVCVYILGVGID